MRFGQWFAAQGFNVDKGAGAMRIDFGIYLRAIHAGRREEGLDRSRAVALQGTDNQRFLDDLNAVSVALEGPAVTAATVANGARIGTSFFARLHENYDVLVFGENHDNIKDADVITWIAGCFVANGRHLKFLFEHLPGAETAQGLATLLGGQGSIDTFLTTGLASLGGKSPLAAWERVNQLPKFRTLLQFARMHQIPAYGHDLPFSDQEDLAREEGMIKANEARDAAMVTKAAAAVAAGTTVFCFVGRWHLDPQMLLFGSKHGGLSVAAIDTAAAPGQANADIRKTAANRWEVIA